MTAPPKKIILISLDTLRADHLGCYGYYRNTSPVIDELAKSNILFNYTFTTCSFTLPAHASMFTSKYTMNHSVQFNNGLGKLNPDKDITLAEVLQSHDYKTAAFVSALVMRKETNLNIGFQHYDDEMTESELNRKEELIRDGFETTARTIHWINRHTSENFFLFVHYFDIHGPYLPPEQFKHLFVNDIYYGGKFELDNIVNANNLKHGIPDYQILNPKYDDTGKIHSFEKDRRYYISQYDAGIRYCDYLIGLLLDNLKKQEIYEDSLIIITADHGESLGENDIFFYHGLTVTPDQIAVPFIIKPSNNFIDRLKLPIKIDIPVSIIDIMPTILSLCKIDYSDLHLEGYSLLEIMKKNNNTSLNIRPLLSENEYQVGIITPDCILETYEKNPPSSNYYPCIKETISQLNGKKYFLKHERDLQLQQISDHIKYFKSIISVNNQKMSDLTENLQFLGSTETINDLQLKELGPQESPAELTETVKDQQLRELTAKSLALEQKLSSMENSIVWQITMKFHTKVIERLLPHNTRRQKYYDLGLKGGWIFLNKGFRSFLWNFREYRSKNTVYSIKCIDPLPEFMDVTNDDKIDLICKKVSIIILTKNAGEDFSYTLEKIHNQMGIQNIEIIIADYGSTDRTLSLAEEYGAKIINILPEEFNPGGTRNLGASQAGGDYILFIVQDVIPIGDYWIHNLVSVFERDEKIAAVSCRQVPRSDADLFACFWIWYNNKIHLDHYGDVTYDAHGIHMGGGNVSFCIRTAIFDTYHYKILQSNDDLDLELRLKEGGYEIIHLFSDGVIHSLNRTPQYFFKMSYVDTKSISNMTGVNPEATDNDENILKLLGGILSLYSTLNKIVTIMKSQQLDISPHCIIEQVKANIQINTLIAQSVTQYSSGQDSLDDLFDEILLSCSLSSEKIKIEPIPILITRFCCELDEFDRYLSIYDSLDDKKDDFFVSLYKIFACVSGSGIAKIYLYLYRNKNLDEKFINLDNLLCRGV